MDCVPLQEPEAEQVDALALLQVRVAGEPETTEGTFEELWP